jgi:hypothetical protein
MDFEFAAFTSCAFLFDALLHEIGFTRVSHIAEM